MLDRETREAREMEITRSVAVNLYIIQKKVWPDMHSFEETKAILQESYETECSGISRRYKGMTFDRYVEYKRRQLCHLMGFDAYGNKLYLYDVGVILYDPEWDDEPEVYYYHQWGISVEDATEKVNKHFKDCSDFQGIQSIEEKR